MSELFIFVFLPRTPEVVIEPDKNDGQKGDIKAKPISGYRFNQ